MEDLIVKLLSCEIFKVGNFKLKSGSFSPIYIDLRQIITKPCVIKDLATAIAKKLDYKPDVVCGVPYTALPIASVFSVESNVPMVMKRKEAKDYGTKKMIEGNICPGDSCLIIEDIVSSGTSVIETAEALRKEGLKVKDCIVVVNRNQGGEENLLKAGITLHPLYDIQDVFDAYCRLNTVESELINQVKSYFENNQYLPVVVNGESDAKCTFAERAIASSHPVAKKLFHIMDQKKSNLCVAVDTNSSQELLDLANKLGPFICILKTHIDIIDDFSSSLVDELQKISKMHNFLIFEDRKFADIGNTVKHQFLNGVYKIQSWADMVTAHALPGNGILEALKDEKCACILIAEMSSKGTLTNSEYKESVFKMAQVHNDCVIGYVAQQRLRGKNLLHMCPGVSITSSSDSLGQQYKSPEEAIVDGADVVIVGRGICKASNVVAAAKEYKNRSFEAYLKRVS